MFNVVLQSFNLLSNELIESSTLTFQTASDVPFVENSIKNGTINYPVALINMEKWVINKVSRQKGEATWPKFDFLATFTRLTMHDKSV